MKKGDLSLNKEICFFQSFAVWMAIWMDSSGQSAIIPEPDLFGHFAVIVRWFDRNETCPDILKCNISNLPIPQPNIYICIYICIYIYVNAMKCVALGKKLMYYEDDIIFDPKSNDFPDSKLSSIDPAIRAQSSVLGTVNGLMAVGFVGEMELPKP